MCQLIEEILHCFGLSFSSFKVPALSWIITIIHYQPHIDQTNVKSLLKIPTFAQNMEPFKCH